MRQLRTGIELDAQTGVRAPDEEAESYRSVTGGGIRCLIAGSPQHAFQLLRPLVFSRRLLCTAIEATFSCFMQNSLPALT